MATLFGEKIPLEAAGPLIRFEQEVPWELFERPGIRAILRAVSMEAPRTIGGIVVVTSTWRPFVGEFTYHNRCDAIDVRSGVDGSSRQGAVIAPTREERIEVARAWSVRIKLRLGIEYDVVFGDARHIDHLHIEHDGSKAMARYRTETV